MYEELVKRLRERAIWINFPRHEEEYPNEDAKLMMDAADAIEELSREVDIDNAAMTAMDAAMPRWIPVTERLPLYGQDVLAVRTYGDGEKCQEVLMAHIAVWNEETGKKWWNATNITHWMPLPQPPKEG